MTTTPHTLLWSWLAKVTWSWRWTILNWADDTLFFKVPMIASLKWMQMVSVCGPKMIAMIWTGYETRAPHPAVALDLQETTPVAKVNNLIYLSTYLPPYLHTYLQTFYIYLPLPHLPTHLPIYPPPTYLLTYQSTVLIFLATNPPD